jgi:hypothetical protein
MIVSANLRILTVVLAAVFVTSNLLWSTVIVLGIKPLTLTTPATKIETATAARPSSSSVLLDKFGIEEIYPSKTFEGKEWYLNMNSPSNDTILSISGGGSETGSSNVTASNISKITREADGSWQVHGQRTGGKYDFQVRMRVGTFEDPKWWKNVEMTGYARIISETSNSSDSAALDWYARGGNHTSASPCQGIALHAGLRVNGTIYWQKEIWHTGGYTGFRSNVDATHPILGKWIGFKAIIFNIRNDSAVRMQTYLDDNATNHWRKVADVADDGGWYADSSDDRFYSANCGRSKDYIVLNSGPYTTFRSDNMIWDFKDLSVREIQPPSFTNMTQTQLPRAH